MQTLTINWLNGYFIGFGAIDGFSRLPVSLECMSDNKSETVFSCFLKGTQKIWVTE